jgi:hypothetical protein
MSCPSRPNFQTNFDSLDRSPEAAASWATGAAGESRILGLATWCDTPVLVCAPLSGAFGLTANDGSSSLAGRDPVCRNWEFLFQRIVARFFKILQFQTLTTSQEAGIDIAFDAPSVFSTSVGTLRNLIQKFLDRGKKRL